MHIVEIFLLSLALGVDCLVVSFSQGLIFCDNRIKDSLLLAISMGLAQSFMPCLSYLGTGFFDSYAKNFSNLIVFLIFFILGVKLIYEAFKNKEDSFSCLNLGSVFVLSIATSIDAFVAGISLKLSSTPILLAVTIIGLTSFLMSLFGFWFGVFFKKLPAKNMEILGGLILVILGIKNLF